jgi:hypothetical protein
MSFLLQDKSGVFSSVGINNPSGVPDAELQPTSHLGMHNPCDCACLSLPYCGGHKYKLDARQLGLVEGTQDSRVAGMRHTGYPSAKGTRGPAASSRHTRFSRLQYLRLMGGYALSPGPTAAHYCPEWESHSCTQNTARPSKLLDELPWVGV